MKPAALYLRVSTDQQHTENQRAQVEQLCRARGFEPVVYEESASAVKRRPVFERMMGDARAGRISAVFVWSLDRLHRSMQHMVADVLELDRVGCPVLSVQETWLDTSGPTRTLLISIFGWVAEYERTHMVERVHAGLARARAQGTKLGRPRVSQGALAIAVEAVEVKHWSHAKAARLGGVGTETLRRELLRRRQAGLAPKTPPKGWVQGWNEKMGLRPRT